MKLSPKGVLAGAVADIVSTNVLVFPVMVVVLGRLAAATPGTKPPDGAFTHALSASPGLRTTVVVLGALASVFGGWVAARVARRSEMLNGVASAVGCMGLGVYAMIRYPQSAPLWQHIAFLILAPVLGALGGTLRRRQMAQPDASPQAVVPSDTGTSTNPLRGAQRAVYVVNRLLMVVVALMFLMCVVALSFVSSQHQPDALVGTAVVSALTLLAGGFLIAGARSLQRGRTNHWAFHVAAVVTLAIPLGVLALGLAARPTG